MASRFSFRARLILRLLLLAGFAATGLTYATCSMSAEYFYAAAVNWKNDPPLERAARMERAAALFPLNHMIRNGPAYFYGHVRWSNSQMRAIAALNAALAHDPYALDLRRILAGLYWEIGDRDRAVAELQVVKQFDPGATLAIMVNVNPATR